MINRLKYISILLVLFSLGCSLDEPDETNEIFFLEDEFNINLIENLGETRKLDLKIETIEEKACKNFSIDYSYSYFPEGQLHRVVLKDIHEPTDCESGSGFANSFVGLGNLEKGIYAFDILLLEEIKNEGLLLVEEDYYEMKMESEKGINVTFTRLNKIPESTIWGYIAFKEESMSVVAQDFIKDIEGITENFQFNAGQYGYFEIEEDRRLKIAVDESWNHHLTFLHKYDRDLELLKTLINEDFCEDYSDVIEIKLWTSEGEVLSCQQ